MRLVSMLFLFGCAESAHLRIDHLDHNTHLLRYNHGALTETVDPEDEMKECCGGSDYVILDKKQKQLPGQYRLQTTITFKCKNEPEKDLQTE
ncbi:hypothetical protein PITCH_A1870003 [uncultured Desulfobacterium sp.]|uniref:Uncharacterized protein n=1 Tax=uncultured Desulfobacterium sp. TaxID=201089 RepID=A0A445MV75_9BACT|nr:hypothetical protein PITCH_A1870003 [uncultured Desulfobacterium sp.]